MEKTDYVLPDELCSVKARAVEIPDSFKGNNKELYDLSPVEKQCVDTVLISNGDIKDRCNKLAQEILRDYRGKELSLFVILNGAF